MSYFHRKQRIILKQIVSVALPLLQKSLIIPAHSSLLRLKEKRIYEPACQLPSIVDAKKPHNFIIFIKPTPLRSASGLELATQLEHRKGIRSIRYNILRHFIRPS